MTKNHVFMGLAGMLILALVAAGCQSSNKAKGLPDGVYIQKDFLITINQGHFSIAGDPGEDLCEQGSYSIDGDKITFTTDHFNDSCGSVCGAHPTYTYQWTFDAGAGQLSFKSVDDLCNLRKGDFTGSSLAYSKLSK